MKSESSRHASFVLNLILAFTIIVLIHHNLARASVVSTITADSETNNTSSQETMDKPSIPVTKEKSSQYSDFASPTDRRRWMIDQLRAMGVPNDVLGLVAQVDFEVQWDSRFGECRGDMKRLSATQLQMDLSKDAEMRAALGDADFKQWDQGNMLWEAMSTKVDVTPAEADAIYNLKKTLEQQELALEQAKVEGTMDDADINDAESKAYSDYNQQMKAVLGDVRYAKSQQLDDAFAQGNLQYALAKEGVNPSDAQFQQLYQAEQQWNKSLSALDTSAPDYAAQYQALTAAHDQTYQQVLGSNVFNSYQEAQDPGYNQMKKYETLWGLDDDKVDYVYNTMKSYESSVRDYQSQISALQAQGQNTDAMSQKLQQITDQTGQALENYLGQDSFNRLQRNHLFMFNQTPPTQ
jgi:hypothetical protein